MIESAYEILRIRRDADPEEVRAAYVKVVRRYPPERFPERFATFHNAYEKVCLSDDYLQNLLDLGTCEMNKLEFAGFLWGDRKELKPEESDLCDLDALIDSGNARKADVIFESVDTSNIEWRGKN
ncbi:MAG: J domain-containing protein [Synergistaceae bacterium]|jgi:DnaJ-class molecular chaperone|nr:J domain-containing protein [Synergistaceae bacterium]